ncbi:MAG: hypothetical protein ACP5JG_10535 [Anaerolineae bacterium]
MQWYRSLTTQQRAILIALAVSVIVVVGLLAWSVGSTMRTTPNSASPLATPVGQSVLPTPGSVASATPTTSPSPTPPLFDVSEAGVVAAEVAEARQSRTRWGTPLTLVEEYSLSVALYQWYERWPPLVQRARRPLELLNLWFWELLRPDVVAQSERTAALYAPQLEELYLRQDWNGDLDVLETQLAYGYARALPDQYGDLVTLMEDATSLDRQIALEAVADGDAMVSVWRYYGVEPGDREAAGLQERVADAICPYWRVDDPLLEDLSCLTLEIGTSFAGAQYREGGLAALDEVILRPPRSTEQILHPERYLAQDEPAVLVPLEPEFGQNWILTETETLGEALIGVLLLEWSEGQLQPDAALDWGGDLLQAWEGPEGSRVVLWQTAWDSARAAGRVYADLRDLMPDPLVGGFIRDTTVPADLPRGRWWAGSRGALFLYRRADEVWLIWGDDPEAVAFVGSSIP